MSYDIYCYRSALGYPDADEAIHITGQENEEMIDNDQFVTIEKIASAIIAFNPQLTRFQFDHQQIAALQGIPIEEAKNMFRHIELNTPEDALATQIQIMGLCVVITVPYWYTG